MTNLNEDGNDGDGVALYYWHGTRVPAEWILHPEKMEPALALTHPNIEQRRAAAEIMGWGRVLRGMPHKVIDVDPDPQIGTLIEADLPNSPGSRFLCVRCATGRDFVLCVPREMQTALEANAASYDVPALDYTTLEVRT